MLHWATAALLWISAVPEGDYPAFVAAAAEKAKTREEANHRAHQALDEARYEEAVALATRVRILDREIAGLREQARRALPVYISTLIARLDDDQFEAREAASTGLRELGAAAIPGLIRALSTPIPLESRSRIDGLLGGITLDREGKVRQWASDATASSEYTPTDWSAKQAAGAPDTLQGGDARTAWAAKGADDGPEWLCLQYRQAVRGAKIRIHENLTPGGVVAIDVAGPDGIRRRAWEGSDASGPAPAWLEIDLHGEEVREIVIHLDTKRHPSWEEIDAVELIGSLIDD